MPDTSDAPGLSKAKPSKDEPETNALGLPEPKREEPVQPHHPGKPVGERQDGAGAGPDRPERTEATPIGSTAARRGGRRVGEPEEPDQDSAGGSGGGGSAS